MNTMLLSSMLLSRSIQDPCSLTLFFKHLFRPTLRISLTVLKSETRGSGRGGQRRNKHRDSCPEIKTYVRSDTLNRTGNIPYHRPFAIQSQFYFYFSIAKVLLWLYIGYKIELMYGMLSKTLSALIILIN